MIVPDKPIEGMGSRGLTTNGECVILGINIPRAFPPNFPGGRENAERIIKMHPNSGRIGITNIIDYMAERERGVEIKDTEYAHYSTMFCGGWRSGRSGNGRRTPEVYGAAVEEE